MIKSSQKLSQKMVQAAKSTDFTPSFETLANADERSDMRNEQKVMRLESNGPGNAGLKEMTCDPADFQSPVPTQNLHVFFEDKENGFSVGVWDTTTMQEAFGPYPGDVSLGDAIQKL